MASASFLLALRAMLALALSAAFAGQAQPTAPAPDDEGRAVERIRAERAAAEAAYERQVKDCAGVFAVSSCVADARAERHAIDTRLDREQQAIDDARRRRRAAERERAIADKLAGEEAAKREAAALARSQARPAASEPVARPAPAGGAASRPAKPQPDAAQRAAQEARARRAYELKLLQAEAHRIETQRRNAEHARKANPGAPLPLPAASAPP